MKLPYIWNFQNRFWRSLISSRGTLTILWRQSYMFCKAFKKKFSQTICIRRLFSTCKVNFDIKFSIYMFNSKVVLNWRDSKKNHAFGLMGWPCTIEVHIIIHCQQAFLSLFLVCLYNNTIQIVWIFITHITFYML